MATEVKEKKARVLSGMRPTGRMHIGNYFGALANWVRLQNEVLPDVAPGFSPASSSSSPLVHPEPRGATRLPRLGRGHSLVPSEVEGPLPAYECFYFIADWHSLTSDYADTSAIAQNSIEIMTDYLAGGLDPAKSVLFLQSLVPEHAELHLLLSMVTPLGWLERVPTYKEALENIKDKDLHNYGFLGYPVLQCGDIVMYGEPSVPLWVPVGEDQVSHVEVSREIVRRFNTAFGLQVSEAISGDSKAWEFFLNVLVPRSSGLSEAWSGVSLYRTLARQYAAEIGIRNFLEKVRPYGQFFSFIEWLREPEVMLTKTPRVPGLDGRKMSKSYGNTIMLSESDADIRAKTKVMVTDPARKRRTDPGNPDICPVYDWHKLFAPKNETGEYTAEGKATLQWAADGCRTASIGCIECKAAMAENLIKWITPIRERRRFYEGKQKLVREIVQDGSVEARKVAVHTMRRVRDAVFGKERILRKTLPRPAKAKRRAGSAMAANKPRVASDD